MDSSKKVLLSTIGIAILIVFVTGVTFAFFNYTRTGSSNTIKVGRISFSSDQTSINLNNIFPIDKANINSDTDYVGNVSIHITGDTTYSEGIEYLVSAVNVNNSVDTKKIPISIDVDYTESLDKDIGILDNDYFLNRGGEISRYKVLANKINTDNNILVGYIKPDSNGIDGIINIRAYIDKDKIGISDTYPEQYTSLSVNHSASANDINSCIDYFEYVGYDYYLGSGETLESFCNGTGTLYGNNIDYWVENSWFYDNDIEQLISLNILTGPYNGTTDEWAKNRTIFSTEQWNSISENGISFQIKVEANEGIWVESLGNGMQSISPIFSTNDINKDIKEIYFNKMNESEMHQRYAAATVKADLTYNEEGEVLAWLETNTTDNTKYTMYIASDGITYLNGTSNIFGNAGLTYVDKIEFNNVNTSRLITMENTFSGLSLSSLDISSFDTSNVLRLTAMFSNCTIDTLDLSSLDFRKVINMDGMFHKANINHVNMSNLNFSDLEYTTFVFSESNIGNLNLSGIQFPKLTTLYNFFASSDINNLDLSDVDISNVQTMEYTFLRATIGSIDFGDEFNVPSLVNMSRTFDNANIEIIDLSAWKTSALINMHGTFQSSTATSIIFGNNFDTSNVTVFDYTFDNTKVSTLDLSNFDMSSASDLNYMFDRCQATTIYVSDLWDVSTVTNSASMFENASVVGENGTTAYSSCTIDNNVQACSNQINPKNNEYARIDNPPDSPGYFTYKAHS